MVPVVKIVTLAVVKSCGSDFHTFVPCFAPKKHVLWMIESPLISCLNLEWTQWISSGIETKIAMDLAISPSNWLYHHISHDISIWVCLKIVYPIVPNGFADHYPYEKWLFHWGYTGIPHFQTYTNIFLGWIATF